VANAYTYNQLLEDLSSYAENSSTTFTSQRERFVMNAENRIASEARGLGLMNVITDDLLVNDASLAKPARWRETVSFQIGVGTGFNTRVMLYERSYEYCRVYWPDATVLDQPKYYADWDYNHWLIAPTPALAYPYEVIYHQRPQPLDNANQTNWTTQYAPQLLLYAALLEAQPFLKRDDRLKTFQDQYDRALKQVDFEQKRRLMDRSMATTNA
jgi:hypothetical protein